MLRRAIKVFRSLGGRSQKILGGLVRVALRVGVRETLEGLPVLGTISRTLQELAAFGTDRLGDIQVEVPHLKNAGEAWDAEQLDTLDRWLGDILESLRGLHEQMEQCLSVRDNDTWDTVADAVGGIVEAQPALASELAKVQKQLRKQSLSLHRIERQLSQFFQVQKGVRLSLEEIKTFLVEGPLATEWADFRRADPEGVRLLCQADALILQGRRDEGEGMLLDLLRRRGVGTTVILRHLGLCKLEEGRLDQLTELLEDVCDMGVVPPALTATVALPTTLRSRPSGPSWPSLPRGLVVGRKYRIEQEVGRGGMASVYRVVGVDRIQQGQVFALKVPAPGIVDDATAADRFVREIRMSLQLTEAARQVNPRPPIVLTLDHVLFDDPATGQELYGLVLDFIEGKSLARLLAERRAERRPLTPEEIRRLMLSVCTALEFAHDQTPPLLHRDVKSANVMVTPEGRALLTDFGIGRLRDEPPGGHTRLGHVMGTPGLMPPELFDRQAKLDERADVFMIGKLLQELMTFDPSGDPEQRGDCPSQWVDLIADSTNQIKGKRPRNVRAFAAVLEKTPTGVPTARVDRRPLVVDAQGRGDFRTVNDAIDAAPQGTCILIRPGHYRGGIRLNNAVDLVGDGPRGEILIENDDGPALRMETNHATARNLTLRCTAGAQDKRFFGVEVPQGRIILEECDITSDSLAGVGVHGVHADPLVRHCTLHACKNGGLFVFNHGHGTFDHCVIADNQKGGVSVTKSANPMMQRCEIRDNHGAGLLVTDCARGTYSDCELVGNHGAGVEVRGGGDPMVQRCRMRGNGQAGVHAHDGGAGTFEHCDLVGNDGGPWSVAPGCLVARTQS